jgi:outer membrane translocation and assembly module TamA
LDDVAVTAQAEVRWNFYNRWTGLAFGGGGRIADNISDLGSAPTNPAGGMGLRYMLVEKQKLSIGIDVAYAEGANVSVYFQVGDWLAN